MPTGWLRTSWINPEPIKCESDPQYIVLPPMRSAHFPQVFILFTTAVFKWYADPLFYFSSISDPIMSNSFLNKTWAWAGSSGPILYIYGLFICWSIQPVSCASDGSLRASAGRTQRDSCCSRGTRQGPSWSEIVRQLRVRTNHPNPTPIRVRFRITHCRT